MVTNTVLLKTSVRVWLMEILVSGFNFFVLMNLIYEPRWGVLVAHQIGMSTRILYISLFAYLLLRYVKKYETKDLVHVGILWLVLTLLFEWTGSIALGRPVQEILAGWNIFVGYMWPYVLPAIAPYCRHGASPRQDPLAQLRNLVVSSRVRYGRASRILSRKHVSASLIWV